MTDTPDKATPTPVDRISRFVGFVCSGFMVAATAVLMNLRANPRGIRFPESGAELWSWLEYAHMVFPVIAFPLVLIACFIKSWKMRFALLTGLLLFKYGPIGFYYIYTVFLFGDSVDAGIILWYIAELGCFFGLVGTAAGALGIFAGNPSFPWRWALRIGIVMGVTGVLAGQASFEFGSRWSILPIDPMEHYAAAIYYLAVLVCVALGVGAWRVGLRDVWWARQTLTAAAIVWIVPTIGWMLFSEAGMRDSSDVLQMTGTKLVDWLALVAFLEMTSPTRN